MKRDDFIKKCVSEKKLLSSLPFLTSESEKASIRRKVIGKLCEVDLSPIPVGEKVLKEAVGKNIENAIGVTQVPLGVAGPLKLRGDWVKGNYFIPLATTEGALVASVNRGCKVIGMSGGADVGVDDVGISRAPVFRVSSLRQARDFIDWLDRNERRFNQIAKKTSRHLQFKKLTTKVVGRSVFVRMVFDTDEAMGMNMATIAADAIVGFIKKEKKLKCVSLSSNYCVDKKPAAINAVFGRGKEVWAEVVLSSYVVKEILKTTPEALVDVGYRKLFVGSALAGSMGFNAQYANIVAAIYLATGQDIAHVVEGSMGITTLEKDGDGVYISVYLPGLILGTVGGGTCLPTQLTALKILGLGLGKEGEAKRFAEIVGGAVLAGEMSLLSSLAQGSLAQAHERLGRRKKGKYK